MFHHFKHIPIYKSVPLVFLLVVLVGLEYDDSGLVSADAGEIRCVEREREALLRFKQGLTDDNGYLSSWGSEDDECCEWYGVECSNTTGHVTEVHLYDMWIGGNISSDLLELHHLNYLDLDGNNFGGSIPYFLGSITSLEYLLLGFNNFTGTIPNTFANLTQLQYFFINVNTLGEPLSDLFGKLSCKSLESIDVSFNRFTGPIPDMRACSKLTDLVLHDNPLSGTVPASLGQLSTVEYLDISADSLQGTVSESLLSKLHNLYWLDLSFNSLTLDLSPDWIPPFRLETITLASCKMGPSFPTWLRTQTNISDIDISDAGISDKVPNWLWSLSSKVTYFNLSQNQLTGTIPDLSSNFFDKIDFSSNKFSGPLPLLHPNISLARFSQNMFSGSISFICRVFNSQIVLLDLSDNQLSGELPNCWNNTRSLRVLDLNNNNFHGEIPYVISALSSLETMHLRGNNLSGQLPPTLRNLRLIDIGGNMLTGKIPPWLGEDFTNLKYLSLRQNIFSGGIPPEICKLSHIQMLDLSGNQISGQIPPCFDNFTSLLERDGPVFESISLFIYFWRSYIDNVLVQGKGSYIDHVLVQWKGKEHEYTKTLRYLKLIDLSSNKITGNIPKAFSTLKGLISLNLSRNSLTGRIDSNVGEMEMLESLDLSNNRLSGKIPVGLAQLHSLSVLHLENNNLSGQIPVGTQLQTFNDAYYGNDGLCGAPLPTCPDTSMTGREEKMEEEGGLMSLSNLQGFCISLIFGFIVGFWGVVGSLVLKKSWRTSYFGLIYGVGDWLYVNIAIFSAKFKRS